MSCTAENYKLPKSFFAQKFGTDKSQKLKISKSQNLKYLMCLQMKILFTDDSFQRNNNANMFDMTGFFYDTIYRIH